MLSNPAYRREAGRHAFGGAYNYIAAVSEAEFVSQALTNSLDAIAHDYPARSWATWRHDARPRLGLRRAVRLPGLPAAAAAERAPLTRQSGNKTAPALDTLGWSVFGPCTPYRPDARGRALIAFVSISRSNRSHPLVALHSRTML